MENTQKTRSFQCGNCGGTVKWNIKRQRLECASCHTPYELKGAKEPVLEHDYNDYDEQTAANVSFPEQEVIICSTCGAQVAFDKGRTAAVCPMCGSSQVMESKQEAGVPPDGIIPFIIDKDDAQQRFRKWVTSRWFAPNRLKQAYQQGKLEGVYLPFWTFDMEGEADYRGKGGTEHTDYDEDGDPHTTVIWDKVRGHVDEEFDDIQICAVSGSIRDQINGVLPFNTQELTVPYNSAYLSGVAAERYSITADVALETAQEQAEERLKEKAKQDIKDRGYDEAQIDDMDVDYYNVAYKHILLPVWVSAFSYNGKQYAYLINGETGEVDGERPYSIPKIIAAVVGAIIVIILLMTLLGGCSAPQEVEEASAAPTETVYQEEAPSASAEQAAEDKGIVY